MTSIPMIPASLKQTPKLLYVHSTYQAVNIIPQQVLPSIASRSEPAHRFPTLTLAANGFRVYIRLTIRVLDLSFIPIVCSSLTYYWHHLKFQCLQMFWLRTLNRAAFKACWVQGPENTYRDSSC